MNFIKKVNNIIVIRLSQLPLPKNILKIIIKWKQDWVNFSMCTMCGLLTACLTWTDSKFFFKSIMRVKVQWLNRPFGFASVNTLRSPWVSTTLNFYGKVCFLRTLASLTWTQSWQHLVQFSEKKNKEMKEICCQEELLSRLYINNKRHVAIYGVI